MKNSEPKAACTCLGLERVIERVGDHSVDTNRWRCLKCGKERTLEDALLSVGDEKKFVEEKIYSALGVSKKVETDISWPTPEGPEVLYTIQTTEKAEIRKFLNVPNLHSLIWDFELWLRNEWKYNEEGYTEAQRKTLTEIRNKWYELKEEAGAHIDE